MTNKKNIDEIIKQSLSEEDAKFYNKLEEPLTLEVFYGLFKGKNRKLSILLLAFSTILFLTTIFTIIKFIDATETVNAIKWGLASLASFFVLFFLDFYYFVLMNKNVMIREIKKLEFQITNLSDNINKQQKPNS